MWTYYSLMSYSNNNRIFLSKIYESTNLRNDLVVWKLNFPTYISLASYFIIFLKSQKLDKKIGTMKNETVGTRRRKKSSIRKSFVRFCIKSVIYRGEENAVDCSDIPLVLVTKLITHSMPHAHDNAPERRCKSKRLPSKLFLLFVFLSNSCCLLHLQD